MPTLIPPLKRRVVTATNECDSVWYSFFRTIVDTFSTKQNANASGGPGGWEDLRFPASAVDPPGAIGPPSYDTTNVGYSFSATLDNRLDIIAQLPHGWNRGNVHPHIHMRPTANTAGDIEWQLKYAWSPSLGQQPAFTTVNFLSNVNPVSNGNVILKERIIQLGNISPPVGALESSILKCQIIRLGSNTADTYASPILYDEFDIHYYNEKSGTDPEYPT